MTAKLFTAIDLGGVTVTNRICVPPMCQCQANDGLVTSWHRMHYAKLASSGAGLVVVEATAVQSQGRITTRCLGLYNDEQTKAFASLLSECKSVAPETKIFIQLSHAGRKGSRGDPAQGHKTLLPQDGGFDLWAPSGIAYDTSAPVPKEMTQADIEDVIQAFAASARRAYQAGFDGIQLHCAHGYLIHQFLSPVTNRRTDAWGGSLQNRMRFGLAVIDAVCRAQPQMPVMLRVSSGDFIEGGWSTDDAICFLQEAKKLGVVACDVSAGGLDPSQKLPEFSVALQAKTSRRVKEKTQLVTYCVGHITEALQAEAILQENDADGVGIGREMIRNPNWGWKAAQTLHAVVPVPSAYWSAF